MIEEKYDFDELMKTPDKNLTKEQMRCLEKILGLVNCDISAEKVDISRHTDKLLNDMDKNKKK